MAFSKKITENEAVLQEKLPIQKSFDIISRHILIGGRDALYVSIDGLSKDDTILRIFQTIQGAEPCEDLSSLQHFLQSQIGYLESEITDDWDLAVRMILSGELLLLIDGFDSGILLDTRTYPSRSPEEPDLEKVTRGARDGLVETIVFNTALIRRRIRDPQLIYEIFTVGNSSKTDVVVGYMDSLADPDLLAHLRDALKKLDTDALLMGEKTLEELLIQKRWYNPFPQAKFTERPDVAAAHLLEGHVIVLVDNSPSAMLFPATLFHFTQHSEDYYQNPLVGTYTRWIRFIAMLSCLFFAPAWLCIAQTDPALLPHWLLFLVPQEADALPLFVQLLLIELGMEILRMASIHTPSGLSTAMGIIGGLLLGQFAIDIHIMHPESVLFMAFTDLATYAVPSIEFGLALRIYRVFFLILVGIAGWWGLLAGVLVLGIVLFTTHSFSGLRYTWPLIPFDGRALGNVLIRKPIVEVKKGKRTNFYKPVK